MRNRRNAHNPHLLRVLCLLRQRYRSQEWIEIFKDIASRNWKIRTAWAIFEFFRSTPIGPLMLMAFGSFSALRCILKGSGRKDLVALAVYPNELAALHRVAEVVAPTTCIFNGNSVRNVLRAVLNPSLTWRLVRASPRSFRFLTRASRRDHFVGLCQYASLLSCYVMFLAKLERTVPRAVAISSASLPQPLALVAAAKALNIPSLFASHACFAPEGKALVPPTDAILMDGAIALSACQQVSRHPFVPILWGVGGSCHTLSIPQKPLSQLSVGLFLTAPVLMSGLEDAVAALYSTIRPARVVVRPHPIAMFTPNLDDLVSRFPGLHISQGESLESSIEQCDIVIAGDSNVHREVLRAGVPSLYLASLDGIARDYWKFVAHRVTMEVDLTSFSLEQLRQFHDESWTDRFRAYDASYLESLSETNARVKGEIESFLTEFESSDHVGTITTPQRTTGEPLKEDSLKLRAATRSDSAMLLKWRNEETVRRNSSNSAEISEEDHARWFERVMNSPLTKIYILERGTTPVGSIRFALNEGVATVSYSIDKLYRGQGLGRFIVREGVRRTITDLGQPVTIRAVVKPDNTPSLAVLRKVGFTVQRSDPSGSLVLEKA